jgi:hypothetical protein
MTSRTALTALGIAVAVAALSGNARAIVGGESARGPAVGFVVHLAGGCTGALIGSREFLTAAHCVGVALRDGRESVRLAGATGPAIPVLDCRVHPGFDFRSAKHDLAVCRLGASAMERPIPLAKDESGWARAEHLAILGFGATAPYADDGMLRRADVTGEVLALQGRELGLLEVGDARRTACSGDSGGPLIAEDLDGTARLVGIASASTNGLCRAPVRYVGVVSELAWVEEASRLDGGEGHGPLRTPSRWGSRPPLLGALAVLLLVPGLARLLARALDRRAGVALLLHRSKEVGSDAPTDAD